LLGVLAQRLVRVINPDEREAYTASVYERRLLNIPDHMPSPTLYRPRADAAQGFKGRTGIYEFVPVDDTMRSMIHDGASEHEMERYARTLTPSIRDDGRARILAGVTTVEEVLRVTRED
jgi:general secretion pathway protein E